MSSEKLGIYSALSKFGGLSYRGKIMMIAFAGTHAPLLALVVWAVLASEFDRAQSWRLIGIALAASLIGTGLTLYCLNRLLRPITLTSMALRNYTARNELPQLPTEYRDEVGVLMSDTFHTLHRLDASLRELSERDTATGLLTLRQRPPIAAYSESSPHELLEHYSLERDLRLAIVGDELELHYQPIYDTRKRAVTAAEALIRWNHPRKGLLMPDAFIRVAEAVGLIEEIGRWTLEQVCKQKNSWRDTPISDLRIAFNLSASQFTDPDLVSTLQTMTRRYQVDPSGLEIEITESSAMDDVNRAGVVLDQLRAIGVRVAIDDFGTGYSSLSYLRTLPLSKLKIDREFVQDVDTNPDHQAIARALIALTRELNLDVLAEGVETGAEVQTLHKLGCHMFQGYYFARPQAVSDFTRLMGHELEAQRFPELV